MEMVVGASGSKITLADGSQLVDGMSSWWAAIHGYNHPELNHALREQLDDFAHVMFGGLTHKPAVDLGKQLLAMTAPNLDCIFYSDSGSVAVEVAIKMALQYWQGHGQPGKTNILTARSGYHGDTFATMSLSDPSDGMHKRFSSMLKPPIYLPKPPSGYADPVSDSYLEAIELLFKQHSSSAAACVVEPIVQNAGGMNIYNPAVLKRIRELCDHYDVLLVLDEIATGFGRTGKLFGYSHADIAPDILCLGKAMTAGYMSFAATLASRKVAEGVAGPTNDPLMHGPTYMGNALAASVALKNLQLISSGDWVAQVSAIESQLMDELALCRDIAGVADARVLGAIGVVEVERPVDVIKATKVARAQGVWLRPFRNLIYTMPPYIISSEELSRVTSSILEIVNTGQY